MISLLKFKQCFLELLSVSNICTIFAHPKTMEGVINDILPNDGPVVQWIERKFPKL